MRIGIENSEIGFNRKAIEGIFGLIYKERLRINKEQGEERMAPEDAYGLILLCLVLYKLGYFKNLDYEELLPEDIIANVAKNNGSRTTDIDIIFKSFQNSFKHLDKNILQQLAKIFSRYDNEILSSNFPIIFEQFFDYFKEIIGREIGIYSLPKDISESMVILGTENNPKNIYNPFGGFGSLCFGIIQKLFPSLLEIDYQELHPQTFSLSQLYNISIFQETQSKVTYHLGNSIENWLPNNKQYDLIISAPPFDLMKSSLDNRNLIIADLFKSGIQSLSSIGKMVILVSQGFLFDRRLKSLRQELVDNDLIEKIVLLPTRSLRHTGIATAIIVIDRDKKSSDKEKIQFFDAQDIVTGELKNNVSESINHLAEFIENKNSDNSFRVTSEKIKEWEYDLHVSRYLELDMHPGQPLSTIAQDIQPLRNRIHTKGRFLKHRDLSINPVNHELQIQNIPELPLPNYVREINESCLLISARWNQLRPTWFEYEKESIFIHPSDIIALKINQDIIRVPFLINILHSKSVTQQLDFFVSGRMIPYLSTDNLMKIRLEIPSLEKQIDVEQALLNYTDELLNLRQKYEKQIHELKDAKIRDLQSLKHTMRNLLSPVVNNILGMKKFMLDSGNKTINADSIYYPPQQITVGDHLDRTLKTILNVSELLHDEYLAKTTVETHDLLELIEDSQSQLNRPDLFIFEKIDYDYDSFIQPINSNLSELTPTIKINRIDFHVVFSNIIQNAIDHGFINENGNYSIRTYLTVEPEYWILEVTNNGKALPQGFTTKEIITRGQKSTNSKGLGIGGADIYSIMQKCNGIFELVNESNNEFPVKYILKFPIIDNND